MAQQKTPREREKQKEAELASAAEAGGMGDVCKGAIGEKNTQH